MAFPDSHRANGDIAHSPPSYGRRSLNSRGPDAWFGQEGEHRPAPWRFWPMKWDSGFKR